MALFWIAKTHDGKQTYFIQEGSTALFASLRASIAGHEGTFEEAIELDAKTARRVPRKMIGRVLTQREAEVLLRRMG